MIYCTVILHTHSQKERLKLIFQVCVWRSLDVTVVEFLEERTESVCMSDVSKGGITEVIIQNTETDEELLWFTPDPDIAV